jgi:hypothetical protein
LVGRPALARKILKDQPGPHDFDTYFAETEEQLKQHFEVVQLPLCPVSIQLGEEVGHYHLTYNNAVLEDYVNDAGQTVRTVYMPTFAQDAEDFGVPSKVRQHLDDTAAEAWKKVGFEVRRIDGLEDLAIGCPTVSELQWQGICVEDIRDTNIYVRVTNRKNAFFLREFDGKRRGEHAVADEIHPQLGPDQTTCMSRRSSAWTNASGLGHLLLLRFGRHGSSPPQEPPAP